MTIYSTDELDIEVLFSETDIENQIAHVAKDIAGAQLDDLVVVAILSGGFIFTADLVRALHRCGLAPEVDFLTLSSYGGGTTSSGVVDILRDVSRSVEGRRVLVVDDILESGRTLKFATDLMLERGAVSALSCVLLDKRVERAVPIDADFKVFDCPDVFVVGYGMDLNHRLRELPFVGQVVKNESQGG